MYHYICDYMYVALPTQLYVCSLSYYTLPKVTVVRHWVAAVVAAATLTTVAAASTASAALSAYIVVCQTQKVQKNCV